METWFDPFGWAARWVPERWLHRAIRAAWVAVLVGFLALRVRQYGSFHLKPLWAAETAVFLVLLAAVAVRRDPVERARGAREVLVPLAGALLPFGLLASPPHPWVLARPALLLGLFWWMTGATALTVWGLWALRRSFSIAVEARELVSRGPYRWVRHPVYLGEILTAGAVTLWRFSLANAGLLAVFVAVQCLRARWEEEKLARALPEYAGYRARSRWLW